MRLLLLLLRPFFFLLYHHFAWTYDLVAAVVSLGRWQSWVGGILPYVQGQHVLELGFGPGHLQLDLNEKSFHAFGLDESRFMARQAQRRLRKQNFPQRLSRGYAQELPFVDRAFDTVAATFPSEYIFDPRTLIEIARVLTPGGKLVILPLAWITGERPLERLAAWLFRVTGQAPREAGQLQPATRRRFEQAGFTVQSDQVRQGTSLLLVVVATKPA